jgi:uncharacterized membrane protein YhhN
MFPYVLLLLIPTLFAVLHFFTGIYPFSPLVTLSCAAIASPFASPWILIAYLCSVVGDWFMAHSDGKNGDKMLLGGIGGFFCAHACFLVYSVLRAERTALLVPWILLAAALTVGYVLFLVRALYPAVPDPALRAGIGAYTGISLAVMSVSLHSGAPAVPKLLFCIGIALILFSDTLIAEERFLGRKTCGRLVCPTYFACHILVAASAVAEGALGA